MTIPAGPFVSDGRTALPASLRGSVLLLGGFDGLHLGHATLVDLARQRAARAGAPLAILQCDPHPRLHVQGPSRFRIAAGPAQARLLAAAGMDLVFSPRFDAAFAAQTPEAFIRDALVRHLGVSAVVAGADFRFGADRAGDVDRLRGQAFTLIVAPDVRLGPTRVSSTAIRHAIRAADLRGAVRLLGHPWITAIRRDGDLWRFEPDQCLPPSGDWPVRALDGQGRELARARLALLADGTARLDAPPTTVLLDWITDPT